MPTTTIHRHPRAMLLTCAVSLIVHNLPTATAFSTSCKRRTTTYYSAPGDHIASPRISQYATTSGDGDRRVDSSMDPCYGVGMDQEAMMESDMLVAVDKNDSPITSVSISKRAAHEFHSGQPRGIAHRAFSVFLFNSNNEMLLTRRAKSKITFPGVWTNTCCSHPLRGMNPCEVDDDFPAFPGIKHAAIRKLKHELGVRPEYVPHSDFHFLTRFHYWAADTVTYGSEAPWGEHEIDYVLFIRCDKDPEVRSNSEEVEEYKYVTANELRHMLEDDGAGHLWSPWFKGIMERGGFEWWENIDEALKEGGRYCNKDITYFDPPLEHIGVYNLPSHGREVGVLASDRAAEVSAVN